MSPQTILVHLDGRARGAETLKVANRIARIFNSHVATVFATQPPLLVASAMDPAAAVVLEYQAEAELALQSAAKAQVAAAESLSDLAIEWRVTSFNTIGNVALHARHADLLVMNQEDPDLSPGTGPSIPAGVIMRAGRPVLLVPYAGSFKTCGDSVLIAWNASRESARAAADALPFLKAAREVHVVSFNPESESDWGEVPGADIGLWLARHNVRVTVHQRRSRDVDVGNQLLSLAADLGTDLVVMGAYGHSRAYEMVLGGATRTILGSMTVPVLMSH
jgi:nucleotide-binding universal stress UspA family protein